MYMHGHTLSHTHTQKKSKTAEVGETFISIARESTQTYTELPVHQFVTTDVMKPA